MEKGLAKKHILRNKNYTNIGPAEKNVARFQIGIEIAD